MSLGFLDNTDSAVCGFPQKTLFLHTLFSFNAGSMQNIRFCIFCIEIFEILNFSHVMLRFFFLVDCNP